MVVGNAHYYHKGRGVFQTRRKVGDEPAEWDVCTPDRWNPDYRIFWLFLKLALIVGPICYAMHKLGVQLS